MQSPTPASNAGPTPLRGQRAVNRPHITQSSRRRGLLAYYQLPAAYSLSLNHRQRLHDLHGLNAGAHDLRHQADDVLGIVGGGSSNQPTKSNPIISKEIFDKIRKGTPIFRLCQTCGGGTSETQTETIEAHPPYSGPKVRTIMTYHGTSSGSY